MDMYGRVIVTVKEKTKAIFFKYLWQFINSLEQAWKTKRIYKYAKIITKRNKTVDGCLCLKNLLSYSGSYIYIF
jgi:hypothetical protein